MEKGVVKEAVRLRASTDSLHNLGPGLSLSLSFSLSLSLSLSPCLTGMVSRDL